MKKEARQKQLTNETGTKNKNRPKSAKAAEAFLNGEKSKIEASQIQIRKTLAERLKAYTYYMREGQHFSVTHPWDIQCP